jgi:hypothetical protein
VIVKMDAEQLRSAEDAGLSVVCGSIAIDEAGLQTLGIHANSQGDAIIRAAVRLSESFSLDLPQTAGSLADLVQEMQWFQEELRDRQPPRLSHSCRDSGPGQAQVWIT